MHCNNSQNNYCPPLELDFIDRIKNHDGDGSYNVIDNLYDRMTPIINKIKSYKKYKYTYVIHDNRYEKKAIQNILDIYDIYRSLIYIVGHSYPDKDDNYIINNVNEIINSIEKFREFSRMITINNCKKSEHVNNNLITDDHIAMNEIQTKLMGGSTMLNYYEIRKLICILYYVVINL